MHKPKDKFKVTFEVRKQIKEICGKLPEIPVFINSTNGKIVPQRVSFSRIAIGSDILKDDSNAKVNGGDSVDRNKAYVQRGKETRTMNHNVNMLESYQRFGQNGINSYVAYIDKLDKAMHPNKNPIEGETPTKEEILEGAEIVGIKEEEIKDEVSKEETEEITGEVLPSSPITSEITEELPAVDPAV